jgi:hypothetical protein
MHFTLHLRGDNICEADHSYGLASIPNPKWIAGLSRGSHFAYSESWLTHGKILLVLLERAAKPAP